MSTYPSTILEAQTSEAIGPERLSVALIGPGEGKRQTLARALTGICSVDVREFDTYPPERNDLPQMLAELFEVVIVDVDTDPDAAVDLVERIGGNGTLTVMVYSEGHDPTLAVRFMRAGAREYLLLPLEQGVMEEAFGRIAPAVRAKVRLEDKNLDTLASSRGSDDQDLTEMLDAIDGWPANECISSLETAAAIAGTKSAPSVGISLELPKTLPADFMDWDSDDLPQKILPADFMDWDSDDLPLMVLGNSDDLDTLEVSKLKVQEDDEVLFQMFRSAPKPKQGMKFASRALSIFRRERQLLSVFDDPHTSTV